jgi:hypothetical protein
MLNRLLPGRADNSYHGQRIALWILGLVAALNGVIGVNSSINTRDVASRADGIPLDTFPTGASNTVLELFALLGVTRIVVFLLATVILIRYRALVSLMFLLLLFGQAASRLVSRAWATPVAGNPPGSMIILGIMALTALGLALSLWNRKTLDTTAV